MKGVESKRCEGSGFRCPMFHGGLTSEGAGGGELTEESSQAEYQGEETGLRWVGSHMAEIHE